MAVRYIEHVHIIAELKAYWILVYANAIHVKVAQWMAQNDLCTLFCHS